MCISVVLPALSRPCNKRSVETLLSSQVSGAIYKTTRADKLIGTASPRGQIHHELRDIRDLRVCPLPSQLAAASGCTPHPQSDGAQEGEREGRTQKQHNRDKWRQEEAMDHKKGSLTRNKIFAFLLYSPK